MNINISIITVCLNSEDCIARTLQSVLSQKNCCFEYIIKDGLSCDSTLDIIGRIVEKKNNENIMLTVVSEKDNGVYDAMNRVVEKAHGKWILFMNAGDTFVDEHVLEHVQQAIKEMDKDIFYGNAIMRDISGDSLFRGDISLINKRMPFCHQAVFVKRSLLTEYPFDINYKIIADYDFFCHAYTSGKEFGALGFTIAVYMMDGISSTKYISKLFEQEDIYYRYGFIKCKFGIHFMAKYMEALTKTLIVKLIPTRFQLGLRKFYAKNIKKYDKAIE